MLRLVTSKMMQTQELSCFVGSSLNLMTGIRQQEQQRKIPSAMAGQLPAGYLEGWRCRHCCCERLAAARANAVVVDGQLLKAAPLADGLQARKQLYGLVPVPTT
jgi:hypothetical protein